MATPQDEALQEFLLLSDDEQIARITEVIDETGIYDENEELKDNWREILAAYRKWRELL
jgi:hypothetical protein